jgi:AraC-like DNA-binding protein
MDRRIDHGKQLPINSTLSAMEIALMCGFSDQSHITTALSAKVGTSPSPLATGPADQPLTKIHRGADAPHRASVRAKQAQRFFEMKSKKKSRATALLGKLCRPYFPECLDLSLIDGATLLVRARAPPETWTTRREPFG